MAKEPGGEVVGETRARDSLVFIRVAELINFARPRDEPRVLRLNREKEDQARIGTSLWPHPQLDTDT